MLKWVKSFRAMSSLRKGAPPPRMKKKNSDTGVISNGNTALYYPNDPPDDENMNEIADEEVDLTVLLPEGKVKDTSVNANIPMMDLLVNLAAKNKLSPAGYTIVVLNEETKKAVEYKPNQTIGSMCPKSVDAGSPRHLTVQLAPKKGESEKQRNTKNAQPFEMTKRFTVNLPQNQKKVLRISPTTALEDVHRQICSEKNLDPFRYKFQLPSDPYTNLSMQMTVGELKTNEINMTITGTVNSAMSMPNLSGGQKEQNVSYMPAGGEQKKKKGFFSFLKKDNSKKFSVQNVQRDAFVEQPQSRNRPLRSASEESPPAQRRSDSNPGARPKTMYAVSTSQLDKITDAKMSVPPLDLSGINNGQNTKSKSLSALKENETDKSVVAPPRKKRRAPAPPQAQSVQNTVQVEISVEKHNLEKQVAKSKVETNEMRHKHENVSKFHSRNSSDSSGYHELTLSGAESPDGPRIDESFEPNHETVSLDSDGHLNGDSGIRDISPPSARKIEVDIGTSQTLPLDRSKKKAALSSTPRSGSLDRAGKKKKAAPLPPGSTPKPPVTSSSIPSTEPVPKPQKKDEDNVAINAVLDSLDEDLDNQDGMMMLENSSVHSEDIDVDSAHVISQHPPRPCAFIAPPPPTEPPPDDTEPVDYNMIINGHVDTVDIGTETSDDSTSYGPVSTRSSTESPVSKNPVYKTEMAQFVEKMKEMTVDGELNKNQNVDENWKGEEICHDNADDAVYIFPTDNEDSIEMENVPDNYVESENVTNDENEDNKNKDAGITDSNRELSEITYDFKVVPVPPEFQSEMEAPDEVKFENVRKEELEQEVEEEEEVITETVEIIYPFSGPIIDEPVDNKELSENIENVSTVSKTPEQEPVREVKQEPVVEVKQKPVEEKPTSNVVKAENIIPKEPEKPKQKEEFVLTFDDLSNVDFSLMRKKKKITPKPKPTHQSTPDKRHTMATVEEFKSGFTINNDNVFITPTKEHTVQMSDGSIITEAGSVRGHKGEVKTKCSELSFSPNSEGEQEHVLEEKSISMINLPAFRSNLDSAFDNSLQEEKAKDDVLVSKTEIVFSTNSTNKDENDTNRNESTNSNLEKSVNDSGVEAETETSSVDHQEVLAAQYKQLQQQFAIWQTQLEENQKLLLSTQVKPADDTSRQFQQQLQAQIQMQKQMIQQMQQSMGALSVQQQNSMEDQTSQKLDQSDQKNKASVEPQYQQKVEQISESKIVPPAPQAPAIPNGKVASNMEFVNPVFSSNEQQPKPRTKSKSRKHIEPKLDPREELMIAIRNFGGRNAMKKVPVNKTHWHSSVP